MYAMFSMTVLYMDTNVKMMFSRKKCENKDYYDAIYDTIQSG